MIKVDRGATGAGVICQGISEEVVFEGDLNGERETAVKIGGRCSRWRGQHVQRPRGRTGPGMFRRLSQAAFEPGQAGPDSGAHGRPLVDVLGSEGGSWGTRIQGTVLVQEDIMGAGSKGAWRKVDKYTRNLGGKLESISRLAVCGGEGRRGVKPGPRLLA